jgi:galactokinase
MLACHDGIAETPMNSMPASQESIEAYRRRFGRAPRWAASAPGRVNLIGEHTDYNEGLVLPMAVDRRTHVLAATASGNASTIASATLGRAIEIDLSAPFEPLPRDRPGAFANYVLGVVHEFARLGHRAPNLDLLIDSDVPVGAGLSSSAALEVATATLLEAILTVRLAPMEKVRLCHRAEHAFPGTPCGIMDMYIATCATEGHALLIDCRTNEAAPIPLPPPDAAAVLVVDTGVRHELAASEYAERRATCEAAAKAIGVPALRDATLEMLRWHELAETPMKRAVHVITENSRTLLAAKALMQRDLTTFGDLLFDGHASLREMFAVSCPELDAVVDAAKTLKGRGVFGARMTGAGFGGCAIVMCEAAAAGEVAAHVSRAFQKEFGRAPECFVTGAAAGARQEAIE